MTSQAQNNRPRAKRAFYDALKDLEPAAIRQLTERLSQLQPSLPGVYLLSKEDMEELRNDALLVTLKKLQEGTFQFQDFDPLSYAMAVARKLLANRLRKRKLDTVPMDGHDGTEDLDPEQYFLQKETETAIGQLLKTFGENCEQIIRLKYYDGMADQAVVEQKLSPYTTVDSLKNKRSQCLKKLAALVKEKGYSFVEFMK